MQRLSGVLLILFGVTLACYAHFPARPPLSIPVRVTEALSTGSVAAAVSAPYVRNFAPTSAAFRERKSVPPSEPSAANAALRPWTSVVMAEASSTPLRSSKPGDFETRVEITRDLQRELKRVGCYAGDVTGKWTAASRAAMSEFMDRVNATLPAEEPDYILLTLVQGYAGTACGGSCPAGQILSSARRCVPRAVLAQAGRTKRAAAIEVATRSNRGASALARIARADFALARLQPGGSEANGWVGAAPKPVAVASLQTENLPWLERAIAATFESSAKRELPGRMAMGGPVSDEATAPAPGGSQKLQWEPIPADDPDGIPGNVTTSIPKQVAMLAAGDARENLRADTQIDPAATEPRDKARKARKKASRSKSSRYARRLGPSYRPSYFYAENAPRYRRSYNYGSPIRYNLTLSTRGIF